VITRESIQAYLARDWERLRRRNREQWRARLDGDLPAALRAIEELRIWASAANPHWPTRQQREEDLETHRRVAQALAKTATPKGDHPTVPGRASRIR
jgi:hypothetical protein